MAVAAADMQENGVLKLVTQNTFLHVVDDKTRVKMNRSFSDSDLASTAESNKSSVAAGLFLDEEVDAGGSRESSSTRNSNSQASYTNFELENQEEFAPPVSAPESAMAGMKEHLHNTGQCRPCLYVARHIGCLNGHNCAFCHFDHKKKGNRPRPCKAKRTQCKQAVAMVKAVYQDDPEALAEAQQRLSNQSGYIRSILGSTHSSSPSTSSKTSQSSKALTFLQGIGWW
mmetsp:Transcript_37691/g.59615  ORF Transcript_37691/g.59615 Transcript_37691/m.59615 type:complete len:228 (-) Transcript_37691:43-726(-)